MSGRTATAAVSWRQGQGFDIVEIDVDAPVGTEVLVQVDAVGICHADIAAAAGDFPVALPAVLGHEGAGIVVEVGDAVTDLMPGDRVVLSYDSCGRCAACQAGAPTRCLDYMELNFTGGGRMGALSHGGQSLGGSYFGQSSFSSLALVSARSAVRVSTDLAAHLLAPLGCGIQTGVGAVLNVARPSPGAQVAIFGLGAVGTAAALAAAITPYVQVVGVDPNLVRRTAAEALGIATTTQISDGVDIAVECSGHIGAFTAAMNCLRTGGTLVVCGAPPFGLTAPMDVAELVNRSITIRGTVEGDSRPHTMVPVLINLIERGLLPIARVVTCFELADIDDAVSQMSSGAVVKPVLCMP